MLKLFRRIRQKLLFENRFSKYLIYALGEIFLVVIGILIALQVNNWNEIKKDRVLEDSTLIEIKNSLEKEIANFEAQIVEQRQLANSSMELFEHIKLKKKYSTKLDTLWVKVVRYYLLEFNASAFKTLENRGIDLIINEKLRNDIVYHYNIEQTRLKLKSDLNQQMSNKTISYIFDRLYNPMGENFYQEFKIKKEILKPVNYENMINDPILFAKVGHSIKTKYRMIKFVSEYIAKERLLIADIQMELAKRNQ